MIDGGMWIRAMSQKSKHIDPNNIPQHIAIIMDGNGRWAKQRGKPRSIGHREGTVAVKRIVKACGELGIKILTLYVFSYENWRRPSLEVNALMRLLIEVRLHAIGDLSMLPRKTKDVLLWGIENTSKNTGLILNLAISYSGRTEIVRAVKMAAQDLASNRIKPDDLTEEKLSDYLYTRNMPDPDMMIRTGGDVRISNFLLWQLAYTELFITDILWPDFDRSHLEEAVLSYQNRERRYGRVKEN
jgi:undecaprenyl diphosphate synthase